MSNPLPSAFFIQQRAGESCAPQPVPFWDAIWDPVSQTADWGLAAASETQNVGGLSARAALETAITLCLFTDRRCPPDHPLYTFVDPSDPRGYWGDGVDVRADLGEAPLGSLLWTLQRSVVTSDTALWAEACAMDALAPMIGQRSIVKATAKATAYPAEARLALWVGLAARDGSLIYDRRFDDVWAQWRANGPI